MAETNLYLHRIGSNVKRSNTTVKTMPSSSRVRADPLSVPKMIGTGPIITTPPPRAWPSPLADLRRTKKKASIATANPARAISNPMVKMRLSAKPGSSLTVSRADIGFPGFGCPSFDGCHVERMCTLAPFEMDWSVAPREFLNQMTGSTRDLKARKLGRVKEGWRYFAERANQLPKAREIMNGWDRVVQFNLDGEAPFYLTFSRGAVLFSDGTHEKPDLTMKGAEDVFYRLMTGELDRMKAFMLGQFKFEGSLKDAARFAGIGDAVRKSVKFPP